MIRASFEDKLLNRFSSIKCIWSKINFKLFKQPNLRLISFEMMKNNGKINRYPTGIISEMCEFSNKNEDRSVFFEFLGCFKN